MASNLQQQAQQRLQEYQRVLTSGGRLPYGNNIYVLPNGPVVTQQEYYQHCNRMDRELDRAGSSAWHDRGTSLHDAHEERLSGLDG